MTVIRTPLSSSPARSAALLLAMSLAGCTTYTGIGDDKIDYRSTGNKTAGLDVPPDLTQLARDSRYQQQSGTVSATTFQNAASAAAPVATVSSVAPQKLGELRMERAGNTRWLATSIPLDQLWPQVEAFWKERGMTLVVDQPTVGVMETDWAENRAKLPNDIIRNTLGKVIDSLYSTGERDKFSTRIERNGDGNNEIYVSHRGMIEVYVGTAAQNTGTTWQPRPADPQLEAEILQRLMIRLGAKEEQAKTAVAVTTAQVQPVRARAVDGQGGAALTVDDPFDRAWRRVGLALDRSGFTVEDRDRTQGLYFVRYVDPALAGKEEPGFFSRLFTFGDRKETGPARYRVIVKGDGDNSSVRVLNAQGAPENGEAGKRIVRLLVEDLK